MTPSCCFCAELSGAQTEFHDLYPVFRSRVVLDTPGFVVMPSLGQLAPGHMLLVPRNHVTSFGELSRAQRTEALHLYSTLRATLSRLFSPVVSFEHGSPRGVLSGGCGIVHAHVHFVPLGWHNAEPPSPAGDGWRENHTNGWLDHATVLSEQDAGYLMWHGPEGLPHLEAAPHVPSQHLRRHVAQLLGEGAWDWRLTGPQRELVSVLAGSTAEELLASASAA